MSDVTTLVDRDDEQQVGGGNQQQGNLLDPLQLAIQTPSGDPGQNPLSDEEKRLRKDAAKGFNATTGATKDIDSQGFRDLEVPTWDPKAIDPVSGKAGVWVEGVNGQDDNRRDKLNLSGDHRMTKTTAALDLQGTTDVNTAVNTGTVQALLQVDPGLVNAINPISAVAKNALIGPLKESWDEAKSKLIGKGQDGVGDIWMRKLWEFRQWHHEKILRATKVAVNTDHGVGALDRWEAAGSTTLTSDIDVNLKGSDTEFAVAEFNQQFKDDGFRYEPGVVYDVNVYALDFLMGASFAKDDSQGPVTPVQEGSRQGKRDGGVQVRGVTGGLKQAKADMAKQKVAALTKLRLHMTDDDWKDYRDKVDPSNLRAAEFVKAENQATAYCTAILEEARTGNRELVELQSTEVSMMTALATATANVSGTQDGTPQAADALMAAQNRKYEAKLVKIAELRGDLRAEIAELTRLVNAHGPDQEIQAQRKKINTALVTLRALISEAALFANEAYVTDGAVNHVVLGMQVGKNLKQRKADLNNSVVENFADILKEVGRHADHPGEAFVKAAKYLERTAKGAGQIGYKRKDMTDLGGLGTQLLADLKGKGLSPDEVERRGSQMARQALGIQGTGAQLSAALMDYTRELLGNYSYWYRQLVESEQKQRTMGAPTGGN